MIRNTLYNRKHYTDPKASELIDSQSASVDPAKRSEFIKQLDQYMYEQAPWLFTRIEPVFYGKRKTADWTPYPRGGSSTYFYFFKIPGQVPAT